MGQFKPMVKMETTEPSVELKLKKGGKVEKKMQMGGVPAMGSVGAPRGGMTAGAAPKKPSLMARRKAMKAMPAKAGPAGPAGLAARFMGMKEGGESKSMHAAEMKKMAKTSEALKEHADKPASKAHKGLKKGGACYATGGVVNGQGGYKTGGVAKGQGGYKTGGVAKGQGGYKKGGKAEKKMQMGGAPGAARPQIPMAMTPAPGERGMPTKLSQKPQLPMEEQQRMAEIDKLRAAEMAQKQRQQYEITDIEKKKMEAMEREAANVKPPTPPRQPMPPRGAVPGMPGSRLASFFKKGVFAKKAGGAAKADSSACYATGGAVNDSGKAEKMPQGSKRPSTPVSINQLSGTYKKGGKVKK